MAYEQRDYEIAVDFEINADLWRWAELITERFEMPEDEWLANGTALLRVWDNLRSQKPTNLGKAALESSTGAAETSDYSDLLNKLAVCVNVEKQHYQGRTIKQTVHLTSEANLQFELYAFSQGYPSLDFVFRDAVLFFCNLHEFIAQRALQADELVLAI